MPRTRFWLPSWATNAVTVVVLAACTLLSGCSVPSIHPLYRESDLVLEPGLVGCWIGEGNSTEKWKFYQKPNEKAYTLIHCDGQAPVRFDVHLVRLGSDLYMDTFPGENDSEPEGGILTNGFMLGHVVAVHVISRVRVEGDALQVAFIQPDSLKEALDSGQVTIRHERQKAEEDSDGAIILTAPAAELQAFAQQHGDLVFGKETVLHRKPVRTQPSRAPARKRPAR